VFQRAEAVILNSEDEGNVFLWNIGIYLQVHKVLQPRRLTYFPTV
jgi:hypothetical protein